MKHATKRRTEPEEESVRVLGRGLRAQRGVHLTLRTIREAAGKTQVEVTGASQLDQADISRLESRANFDDCVVSTLKRYIAALGGQLELVATFGDKKIILAGVSSDSETALAEHANAVGRAKRERKKPVISREARR